MDQNHQGTITLSELKKVLEEKFQISAEETRAVFKALDSNHDEEIHYSDFLAAMVNTRIALHDDLLQSAFKKFDTDNSGFITPQNLREVLGDTFEGEEVEKFVDEADKLKDGRISYKEFVSYLRGDPFEEHANAADKIIDAQLEKTGGPKSGNAQVPVMRPKSGRLSGLSGKKGDQGGDKNGSCCLLL